MRITNPEPILPPTLAHWFTVGFTGHRDLSQPDLVKQQLRKYIATLREKHGNVVTISSAASGSDTLFLEVAENLGLPSAVILPFNQEVFREDFDADEWQRATQQFERSIECRTVAPCDNKEEAYLEASVQTIERCDLLLAVLDPEHSHGNGGTADAVNYARIHNKPVVTLNPGTGELQTYGELPEHGIISKQDTPPKKQVETSFEYFDELAKRNAPKARRIAISVISLHLLATAIAIVGAVLHLEGHAATAIGTFKVIALGAAWFLVVRHRHHHHDWLNARPAAELCRYFASIWYLRRRPVSLKWTVGEGFNPLIKDLMIAWQLDKSATLPLNEAKRKYVKDRIRDQLSHYESKRHNPTFLVKLTQRSTVPLTILAIAGGVIALLPMEGPPYYIAKLASMLLPLLVAALLSSAASLDSPRRHQRYGLMIEKLKNAKKTIEAAQTWPGLWRAVDSIEYELMNEVEEWHSLSRFSSSH